MHGIKLLQTVSVYITFSSEFTNNVLLWTEIKNAKRQLEKKMGIRSMQTQEIFNSNLDC